MLIIELALIAGAMYRGWLLEAFGLIVLLFLAQVAMVELNLDTKQINLAVELLFMAGLLTMIVYPKKHKVRSCETCGKPLGESTFSCPHCGAALTNETRLEQITEDTYSLTAILKDKNDFETIKNKIISQYTPHGYTNKVIDKAESIMLKNTDIQQSYISAKIKGHEMTLEAFNVERPKIQIESDGSLQN